jgi:hypothetical protein
MSVKVEPRGPGLTGYINVTLNAAYDVFDFTLGAVIPKTGNLIVPTILGGMGGWLSGVSKQTGLLQGLASGAYHVTVYNIQEKYIKQNIGKGPYDLNPEMAALLRVIGFVGGIAVPIFITYQYGQPILDAIVPKIAAPGSWMEYFFVNTSTREYSILSGLAVNITPIAVQYLISAMRHEDPRKENSLNKTLKKI